MKNHACETKEGYEYRISPPLGGLGGCRLKGLGAGLKRENSKSSSYFFAFSKILYTFAPTNQIFFPLKSVWFY
jgi:hypothetical protein